MIADIQKIKGIPPRVILEREISKQGFNQRSLAETVGEHYQTLNAILKGKRKIPVALALKIEKVLGMEEGTLSVLQTYFEIEKAKKENIVTPNLDIISRGLFWDTDFNKIDWQKHSEFIIWRTFERGSKQEQEEIIRFYGQGRVDDALSQPGRKQMKLHKNISKNAVL